MNHLIQQYIFQEGGKTRKSQLSTYLCTYSVMICFIQHFFFLYRIAEDFPKMTNPSRQDKKHFQNRKEKSTGILVGIVLVFFFCHILRVSIQVSLANGLDSDQVQAFLDLPC